MAYRLQYSDYPGTAVGPPDPARWVGPPGPMGPPGPVGPTGPHGPPLSVTDYGVKMDGVTDDSGALQALVNAAGNGALIYFPPSAHSLMLSQSVYPQSGQTWWAYPGTVTIAPTAGHTGSILLWSTANTSNITLYGLTLDGGGSDFANANLVTQAYHVNGLTFDRVTFQNTRGMTFNGSGVNDLIFRGCKFINCGNHWKTSGHWLDATQSITNSSGDGVTWGFRTRIEDCQFLECGDNINLGGIQDIQVVNNVFKNTSKPWLTMTDASAYFSACFAIACTDIAVIGNLMIGITGNAIDWPGVWEGVISGNVIRGSGQLGIGVFDNSQYTSAYPPLRGSRNITITGNVIENSNQWGGGVFHDGIGVAGGASSPATNIRVANNVITDTQATKTQQYGVSASGSFSAVWVETSNYLAGNATGPLNGVPQAGLLMADDGNMWTNNPVTFFGAATVNGGPLNVYGNATVTGTLDAYDMQVGFDGGGSADLRIDGASNAWRTLSFKSAGKPRWTVMATGSGESGANSGSDFWIAGTADDGTTGLGVALGITRATGAVALLAGMGVFGHAAPASRPTVTGAKGGNAALASLLAALASYGLITDSTTA